MTLADAKRRIGEYGTPFGAVAASVSDDEYDALAEWYVAAKGVPNLAARGSTGGQSGNGCPRCGGLLVRTGTCETCSQCGESTGGCG